MCHHSVVGIGAGRAERAYAIVWSCDARKSDTSPHASPGRRCEDGGACVWACHEVSVIEARGPGRSSITIMWPVWQIGQVRSETPVRASAWSR